MPEGAIYTRKWDQVVKVWGPLKEGLRVCPVVAGRYVSEEHLDERAENWWRLLQKVAIIVSVYYTRCKWARAPKILTP